MVIETVTVDRGGQPVRINKSDFDPEKEQLWADKTAKERSAEDTATKQERAREDAPVKRGRSKKDAD